MKHVSQLFKKPFLLLAIFSLCTLALVACSSGNTNTDSNGTPANQEQAKPTENNQENVSIDMALFYTENDAYNTAFKEFAELVNKETEGRVTFNPYYSGALVSLFDTLDAVRNGSVDAGVLSAGGISGQIPAMGLLEILGVFQNEEQFKAIYEEITPFLDEILAKEGLQLLYWGLGTTDNLVVHKDQFLTKLEQFKGLKMRSQGRWMAEQLQLIEASPVSMDPSELYLALQNGTVDSTYQGVSLATSQKLYEVTPKAVSTGLSANAIPYVVNQEIWDKISSEDQETIKKIANQIGLQTYNMLQKREQEDINHMKEQGAEFYILTNQERFTFLEEFNKVKEKIAESAGEEGQKLLEMLKKYE